MKFRNHIFSKNLSFYRLIRWSRLRSIIIIIIISVLILTIILNNIQWNRNYTQQMTYRSDMKLSSIDLKNSTLSSVDLYWFDQNDGAINFDKSSFRQLSYRVHAFYYLWYDKPNPVTNQTEWVHWNHKRLRHWNTRVAHAYSIDPHHPPDDIASSYYPKLGPYSSKDLQIIEMHLKMAQFAGVGVFVVSWYPAGMSDENGKPVDQLIMSVLDIALKYDIKVCLHFENYKNRDAHAIRKNLEYIFNQGYTKHLSYYKVPSRNRSISDYHSSSKEENIRMLPVIYVYDSYLTNASEWNKVLNVDGNLSIRNSPHDAHMIGLLLNRDDCHLLRQYGFDGGYTYFVGEKTSEASSPETWIEISKQCKDLNLSFYPGIGPGYHDLSVRPWNSMTNKNRQNGLTYTNLYLSAVSSEPTGLNIVTFNEWHESTQIEPAIPYTRSPNSLFGKYNYMNYLPYSPEFYLRLTRLFVNKFDNFTVLPKMFLNTTYEELQWLNHLIL